MIFSVISVSSSEQSERVVKRISPLEAGFENILYSLRVELNNFF
jgi:hypothetical protein